MGLKVNKDKAKNLEKLVAEDEDAEYEEVALQEVNFGDGKDYYWDRRNGDLYDEDMDEVDGLSDLYDDIVEEFDLMIDDDEPPTPKKKNDNFVDADWEDDIIVVEEFKYKGKKYSKDDDGNVYDMEGEEIGKITSSGEVIFGEEMKFKERCI